MEALTPKHKINPEKLNKKHEEAAGKSQAKEATAKAKKEA